MRKLFSLICVLFSTMAQGASLSQDLIQHPESESLSTRDIATSLIYPESRPLNMVLIHPYNPLLSKLIGLRVPSIKGPFGEDAGEHYVVISRPMKDETSLLLRPHYWVTRGEAESSISGNIVIQVNAEVIKETGETLLTGSHQVNVHGKVCSPSNMPLSIEMTDITHNEPSPFYVSPEVTPGISETITIVDHEYSHLLYSRVEKPDQSKALTCHWIPKQSQWEKIFMSEFDGGAPSQTIGELIMRLNSFMEEDPHWTTVRDLLTF